MQDRRDMHMNIQYAYRILLGKCERKRPLGRLRHRGEDQIKINFKYDGNKWTGLIWLRAETRGRPL